MGRELDKYLETLYNEQTGFVYVALKEPGNFDQYFYQYPAERAELVQKILSCVSLGEVYICPSLFADSKATKDQCLGSSTAWVDFDGNYPKDWPNDIPLPSMVVQTSSERNVHAYWKLDAFHSASEIEDLNRRLCYFFGADISGWDANQLLRPPETRNHKRSSVVGLTTGSGEIHSWQNFVGLPKPPTLPKNIESMKLPTIEEAHANIDWPAKLRMLFDNGLPEGSRHQGMFALACGLAELNVPIQYIATVILYSDNHAFHKFEGRPDQMVRIIELVTRAVSKVKQSSAQSPKESKWQIITVKTLLTAEYHLEWWLRPYIHKTTCGILSGPPGVGKSLMALSLAQSMILNLPFLGFNPEKLLKLGFVSLEMDAYELSEALKNQTSSYSSAQMDLLTENFLILPFGEPKYFNDKEVVRQLMEFVGDNHLDGILVDSLSSTTPGDLSSEKETKFIFEVDAGMRSRFSCFSFYIHHNRKAQADNKRPNKLADLHGSVHIQSKPTTILTLWPLDQKGSRIALKPLKLRSHKLMDDIVVSRNDQLHYEVEHSPVKSSTFGGVIVNQPEEEDAVGDNNPDVSSDGEGDTGGTGFDNSF